MLSKTSQDSGPRSLGTRRLGNWNSNRRIAFGLVAAALCGLCGCQDGPLYALKTVNPYFPLKDWREDEAYGVTDHQRRKELSDLADVVGRKPEERQRFWADHLSQLMEHDPSAEMRRLAVLAAGNMQVAEAGTVIEAGLDDDSFKVRMEACRALGKRSDESASRLLAKVLGSDPDDDVRHAAMKALGNQTNSIAVDALRMALQDRNPATRDLAVQSLRGSTGKNYGDDPQVWIAALDGKEVEERPTSLASRLRSLF